MFVSLSGLAACLSENKELKFKLLRMQLEALVKSGGEKAAEQALETFTQVIPFVKSIIFLIFLLYHYISCHINEDGSVTITLERIRMAHLVSNETISEFKHFLVMFCGIKL